MQHLQNAYAIYRKCDMQHLPNAYAIYRICVLDCLDYDLYDIVMKYGKIISSNLFHMKINVVHAQSLLNCNNNSWVG